VALGGKGGMLPARTPQRKTKQDMKINPHQLINLHVR
jgi:hypothetical protein